MYLLMQQVHRFCKLQAIYEGYIIVENRVGRRNGEKYEEI